MLASYTVDRIDTYTWNIDDENGDSAYLIIGRNKAVLIDTTCGKESLQSLIRTITDKPVEVLLTHGHWDHSCHANEFPVIYIHPYDQEMILQYWKERGISYHGKVVFIREDDVIDLGDRNLKICEVPGHTRGSIVVLDEQQKNMFCGDAFGSGSGVLMAIGSQPGKISLYREELLRFQQRFIDSKIKMYGGHRKQENGIPGFQNFVNPLSSDVVEDLIALCSKLLSGDEELVWKPQKEKLVLQQVYYVSWKKAAMWVTKEQCI